MPIVIWTQIANALTMISPLIVWFKHRNAQKECKELSCLKHMLIIHIPVSFMYHMVSAFNTGRCIRGLLKRADLSLIHIYALKACGAIKRTQLSKASTMLNAYCVTRVFQGYEDTKLRISSLYICTHDALRHIKVVDKAKQRLIILGVTSSLLFYFDEDLKSMGHSMFHILLGFLHHEVLRLITV